MTEPPADTEALYQRAQRLGLYGLVDHWDVVASEPWLDRLVGLEEVSRQRRSLERRLRNARLGRFKPMADFDYHWPKKLDRPLLEDLFALDWVQNGHNAILIGPNGTGKTMIAKNLVHQAVLQGKTARFCTASELLGDLAALDGALALQRRLRHYARPMLLAIDEIGYLSYDHRHADLLFEVVSRRYGEKSLLITTNQPFAHWNDIFPNASCVVTLIDRLVHHAEILHIEGESFRLKESREQRAAKAKKRSRRSPARAPS
jgi:DNA replication protein DnaC